MWLPRLGRFLRSALGTLGTLFGAVAVFGWLKGWRSLDQYALGLLWAGFFVLILSIVSGYGTIRRAGKFQTLYTRRTSAPTNEEKNYPDGGDGMANGWFFLEALLTALAAMGLGALLQTLA